MKVMVDAPKIAQRPFKPFFAAGKRKAVVNPRFQVLQGKRESKFKGYVEATAEAREIVKGHSAFTDQPRDLFEARNTRDFASRSQS